jgi:hypothetical protein
MTFVAVFCNIECGCSCVFSTIICSCCGVWSILECDYCMSVMAELVFEVGNGKVMKLVLVFFALFSTFFHSWRHTDNKIWPACWLCQEVGDFAFVWHLGDTFGFNWELICDGSWRLRCVLSRLLLESNPCCIQVIQLCYMVPSFLAILFWFNSH